MGDCTVRASLSVTRQPASPVPAQKLQEFQDRSLGAFTPFAIFLDTIHRGGEAFLVALGVDLSGEKMALGFLAGLLGES